MDAFRIGAVIFMGIFVIGTIIFIVKSDKYIDTDKKNNKKLKK